MIDKICWSKKVKLFKNHLICMNLVLVCAIKLAFLGCKKYFLKIAEVG